MPALDSASRPATASFLESRTSLPYPTFSKEHSKEALGKPNIPTPDPTDLTESRGKRSGSPVKQTENVNGHRTQNHHAPPSPPLTGVEPYPSRKTSKAGEKNGKVTEEKQKDGKTKLKIRADSPKSSSSVRVRKDAGTKAGTSKTGRPDTPTKARLQKDTDSLLRSTSNKSPKQKPATEVHLPRRSASDATMSPARSAITVGDGASESANDSDATSIAPNQHQTYQKPMTPPQNPPSRTQMRSSMSMRGLALDPSPVDVALDQGPLSTPHAGFAAPPPPPPPPEVPLSIPRVDYLLRNGGLNDQIPKTLLAACEPSYTSLALQPQVAAAKVFEPFNRLLDDYDKVMNKNGSLAVATGYRSVARRLLDRLEAVFARDISCESCRCLMCDDDLDEEQTSGVSWGEVLELVSGRRDLPHWPPFNIAGSITDPGLAAEEHIPMQKLDIDVPDEYREHYIRQSRKTKLAVDKWLSEQTEQTTSPPEEVDDETLTFAMLTHLEPEQRYVFCALLGISSSTPVSRSKTPQPRSRPPALASSAVAIQRLYRLPSLPRDPETAIYMLNNPGMHHVLATLAAISNDEWEILVSGRFDGFLRSGAEDPTAPPLSASVPPRWHSRSATPFSAPGNSRGTTTPSQMDGPFRPASQPYGSGASQASFGGPIALDEETEIAALAEIERDIYLGMEALEDAFEALHCKAEAVRRALRERGAGLSVANQSRRGSIVEARLGTPSSNLGQWEGSTEDDWIEDDRSLAPDDSASNISSNRRRRPKRRSERRTPAPVEEEDEMEVEDRSQLSRRERDGRNSRRR